MPELPRPFSYPEGPHRRRHGPQGYKDAGQYKPWLRDEFTFRCVYCLEREAWYPSRSAAFSGDHFVPQALDPSRATDYGNLVYACARCNSLKRACVSLPDPTSIGLDGLLQVNGEGEISGRTTEGARMIELLHLDVYPATQVRKETLMVLRAKQKFPDDPDIHRLFLARFGYPDDLPDLRDKKPPRGNSVRGSEADCYYARRERQKLPDVY